MTCSKTYCPYPFIGASLQSDGVILPCGQYMNEAPLKIYKTIDEARNSPHMAAMREKMLNNERDSGCQCHEEELAGLTSMRQGAIQEFGVQPFGSLKVVEIFFNNVCNLKCRSCASPYSHLWFEDEKKLYGKSLIPEKYILNNVYNELDVSQLLRIKIYGGEPIGSPEANNFFKKIIDANKIDNLEIELSTNGTREPQGYIHDALLKCKMLSLNISIDAYGKLNDYMRSGSNWDEIIKNLNYYNELIDARGSKHTTIRIHSVISIYNANLISELDDFIKKNYPKFIKFQQMVQYPLHLNIQFLPKEYKDLISSTMDESIKAYMYASDDNLFDHFINFHKSLDAIRNESLENLNPLLTDYINSYNITVLDSKPFFLEQFQTLSGG